ncbi:hypothetical protein FB451DRAFT_1559552 [Mycena latifolia]|nr:hypothetical protein FB451DRAFT_1559552 [Mycena latifolia]
MSPSSCPSPMAKPAPLPDFEYVQIYEGSRHWIWPDAPYTPSSTITEPARLTKIIHTDKPDDRWLTAMGELADADVGDGPAEVRYIDLPGHPQLLEFSQLRGMAMFVVRDEYKQFIQHVLSLSLSDGPVSPLFRFFVTGQPGIGKPQVRRHSLYLLGLGKPVFWVQEDGAYYFNSHGVQRLHNPNNVPDLPEVHRALQESWVLIDADQAWMPSKKYAISPFIIWTSSPLDSRWQYFRKTFMPSKRWVMKPWSTKEIAAAACVFSTDSAALTARGPPRDLVVSSSINNALSRNPFAVDVADRVFLVPPAVVKDSGGCRLTFELAENRMDQLQQFVSWAFDVPSTRRVAGRLVEGLMHRSLSDGIELPAVFGSGAVAVTLELLGNADVFVPKGVPTTARPLYLRPLLPSFAAVDVMVVTAPNQLGLLRTSLADTHSRDFGTMLGIIARLQEGAGVKVNDLDDVVYCLVGSTGAAHRVQDLVRAAHASLAALQKLAKEFRDEVDVPTNVAARVRMFRVVGLNFDPQTGFRDVGA